MQIQPPGINAKWPVWLQTYKEEGLLHWWVVIRQILGQEASLRFLWDNEIDHYTAKRSFQILLAMFNNKKILPR